jgi:hypothetical protein
VGVERGTVASKRLLESTYLIFDDDAELTDPLLIERAVKLPNLEAAVFRQVDSQGAVHRMQPALEEDLRLAPWFGGYGALISRHAFETVGGFFEPIGY